MAKTIRVGAQVNGRKSIDSKTCETIEEALENLKGKVLKYGEKNGLQVIRLCAGVKSPTEKDGFIIYPEGNEKLKGAFEDICSYVVISTHGLP
jgi:hypothetical protein